VERSELRAGGLVGWVQGDGDPVLLLHGGPGLAYGYLDGLGEEIGDGYLVAAFQQRGL
jgi:pimeloyl-ACP methyl ester carboxylesterase